MRVSNINKEILRQTTETLDQAIFAKFPKLAQWLDGTIMPTFKQIVTYAKAVDIPFGYFFLEELPAPDQGTQIPHYRTTTDQRVEPSKNLTAVIKLLKERQMWARDLLLDMGAEPLPFANQFSTASAKDQVIAAIYNLLQISNRNWAHGITTWQAAFKFLVEQTEKAGIFVVVNGIVGNNTRRPLQVEEFRGFVLYDNIAPFVFVNGKDAVAGKIFTLVHEIVHVLIGESGSFDFSFGENTTNAIENFCNQVAADFLVPTDLLAASYHASNTENIYNALARQFKVSQLVIARRLLDTGIIERRQFFSFYNDYQQQVPAVAQASSGNFYNMAPYRVSSSFLRLIDNSLKQNKIQPTDAFHLTGLKASTYDVLLEKMKR